LTLRAYDGSTKSPPSNEILVRAQVLIASAMAGMPSAALAGDASSDSWTNTTSSTSFASTSSTSSDSGFDATASADAAAREADELAASNETLASIAFMGEGDHLEGLVEGASGVLLDGFDANASGGTLAAWLRPLLDDSLRHVVVSLAAGADAGSDLLELAIVDAGDVELTLRDDGGRIGHQVRFVAGLQADVWQHVALVFDPLAARPFTLLVDGVAVPDDGGSLGALGATVSGGVLRIGAGLEGESFSGRIGHVALWSRAVETDELFFASDRGHALDLRSDAMGAGLAHYWRLGEGDGEVELDLAGTEMPIDLMAVGGVLAAVEDAPAPLE
jgi:hypothetical protein